MMFEEIHKHYKTVVKKASSSLHRRGTIPPLHILYSEEFETNNVKYTRLAGKKKSERSVNNFRFCASHEMCVGNTNVTECTFKIINVGEHRFIKFRV